MVMLRLAKVSLHIYQGKRKQITSRSAFIHCVAEVDSGKGSWLPVTLSPPQVVS